MTNTNTTDFAIGRRLTAITMGIDALERAASGPGGGFLDTEGLVPIYLGRDLVPAEHLTDWAHATASVDDLARDVALLADGPRKLFLTSMLTSLRAAIRLFAGEDLSFADKLTQLVGVPAAPVDPAQIKAIQAELDRLMTVLGFRNGTLEARVRAWQADRALDRDQLLPVFEQLMDQARARTNARIWDTGNYNMELRPVRDVPYTARCDFGEGAMELNVDNSFTRSMLKHLVCHEVFPGHSTQLISTHAMAASGTSPADALLCTANAVTGCVQEGIGDQGIELIDWVEDEDDAAQVQFRRLLAAVATSAAWYLMGAGWSTDRVADFLRDEGFGQPPWVKGRIRLAQHPFRGAFIASYWFGNEAVREVRERVQPSQRRAFYDTLYGTCQSPESLRAAL